MKGIFNKLNDKLDELRLDIRNNINKEKFFATVKALDNVIEKFHLSESDKKTLYPAIQDYIRALYYERGTAKVSERAAELEDVIKKLHLSESDEDTLYLAIQDYKLAAVKVDLFACMIELASL